jgi:hypothetical protein
MPPPSIDRCKGITREDKCMCPWRPLAFRYQRNLEEPGLKSMIGETWKHNDDHHNPKRSRNVGSQPTVETDELLVLSQTAKEAIIFLIS